MIACGRSSPVTIEGKFALHKVAGAFEFDVGAAAGRGFHIGDDGQPSDTSRTGSGHRWVGSLVMPNKRKEIAEALGFDQRTWNENWRYRWEAKGMSHRCGRGGPDALHLRPVTECLWCAGKLRLANPSSGEGQSHQARGETPPSQRGNPVGNRDASTRSEKQGEMPTDPTWIAATSAMARGDFGEVRLIALALKDVKIAALALQAGDDTKVWRQLNDLLALAYKAELQPEMLHAS
jgi:hypothetical protein